MQKIYLTVTLFIMLSGCTADPDLPSNTIPVVSSTSSATAITATTARSGGMVSAVGGSVLLDRGICWSTLQSPTVNNFKVSNAGGPGIFSCDLTGLTPGVTYYIRAYATNATGTAYGNQVSFTTLFVPVISTNAITGITTTTAVSGGTISSSGSSSITAKGVCWSTVINPVVTLATKTNNGSGSGNFSSSITGLTTHTTYYVRAYATSAVGTAYGQNISFTTN